MANLEWYGQDDHLQMTGSIFSAAQSYDNTDICIIPTMIQLDHNQLLTSQGTDLASEW